MAKAKYATAEDRTAALRAKARAQMLAQHEQRRQASGTEIGYYGCHRRVRTARGKASDQLCVECGKEARHWAHIHETDPADPRNYQPMCQKCHWAYDGVHAKSRETMGAEGRSAQARTRWARKTPEERRAILLKAWETRRQRR